MQARASADHLNMTGSGCMSHAGGVLWCGEAVHDFWEAGCNPQVSYCSTVLVTPPDLIICRFLYLWGALVSRRAQSHCCSGETYNTSGKALSVSPMPPWWWGWCFSSTVPVHIDLVSFIKGHEGTDPAGVACCHIQGGRVRHY